MMYSSTRPSFVGCRTCKLCKPGGQPQMLMPQNFLRVLPRANSTNTKPASFYLVTHGLIFGNLASVPFDSLVDPGPYVCFNCWWGGHSHLECPQPSLRDFCQNCGRTGVLMSSCPRCAVAYLEFGMQKVELRCCGYDCERETKQLWTERTRTPRAIRGIGQPSTAGQYPAHEFQTKSSTLGPLNLYFKALRDVVEQNIQDNKSTNAAAENSKEVIEVASSINNTKSTVSSDIGEEYLSDEEEEDLDKVVVDENEKSQPQTRRPPSKGVREFMNLMDAVKHLPIDAQSSVALQFVRKRRVMIDEKKKVDMTVKI